MSRHNELQAEYPDAEGGNHRKNMNRRSCSYVLFYNNRELRINNNIDYSHYPYNFPLKVVIDKDDDDDEKIKCPVLPAFWNRFSKAKVVEKQFKCDIKNCSHSYDSQSALNKHKRNNH